MNVENNYITCKLINLIYTYEFLFIFSYKYKQVDETTRANMWKLRQTWSEVFPVKKMFALDVRVHSIDPAWPVMSLPPGTLSERAIKVTSSFFSFFFLIK